MALQVWLPLNKDTRNTGLSNVTVTNNGATLSNNGVFDKCYKFTYNSLSFPSLSCMEMKPNKQFSVAFFVKGVDNGWVIACQAWEFRFRSDWIQITPGPVGRYPAKYTVTTEDNQWRHVAFTWNGSTLVLYVDGEKRAESSFQADYSISQIFNLCYSGTRYINDFRIYDHCITEEDVKRIYNCKIMDICASSYNGGFFYDNSGLLINDLVSTGLTYSGNSMYFNGSTTQIRPKDGTSGLNISGGTLSVWFKPLSKPSDFRIVYIDSKSKMALGFYTNNYFIVVTSEAGNKSTFSTDSLIYNQLNNVIISYDQSYNPLYCYVNGVKAATGTTNNWIETAGLTIGGRQSNTANKFNGYISKVTVYRNQLTEDEAKQLYAIGPCTETDFSKNYTRLEYIETNGDGKEYIDTEVLLSNNDKFEIKFQRRETASTMNPIFGAIGGGGTSYTSQNNFSITYLNSKYAIYCDGAAGNGNYAWNGGSITNKNVYTIIYNGLNVAPTINGSAMTQITAHTLIQNTPTVTTYMFGRNTEGGGITTLDHIKMFYCKIWSNNRLLRYFIPSKRNSDNVIGMYDLVSNTFFTNVGTGTFTAGPEI